MKLEGTTLDIEPLTEIPTFDGMPEQFRGRKADALQVPINYLGIVDQARMTGAIHLRFSKILNAPEGQTYATRYPRFNRHFIAAPGEMLAFAKGHWRYPGQDRYHWFNDPKDGVMYGFLTAEAIAEQGE